MKLDKEHRKIEAMTEAELETYAALHKVDMSRDFADLADARQHVCAALGIDKPEDADDAGTKLDTLARAYQREHPNLSYESCLGAMRKAHANLAAAYAAHGFGVNGMTGRTVSS